QTTIHFQLPKTTEVTLKIFNILGQYVCTLSDQQRYVAGKHHLTWDGKDKNENWVTSGLYFYRLNAEELVVTGRMVLLR
ncbi:MAG: FlgD immunoglobulin-like domain containing protein, partial [bacterium]